MSINQPTLVQFETVRKQQEIIPYLESNSFFTVGSGQINLFTVRDNVDDYRFDLFTDQGKVYTGPGNFTVSGDILDTNNPYRNMSVIPNTSLIVNQMLTVNGGELDIYGTLELLPYSQLIVDGGNVVCHPNSVIVINDNTNLKVESGSLLTIYGRIDIHVSSIDFILNAPHVIVDSAAVLNVSGIEYPDRTFSLTDYDHELRERYININTQGERNFPEGRVGHIWRQGSPHEPSQVIGINLQLGECPLGDFRLPILGLPNETYPLMQTVSDLHIRKNSTLYISESFGKHTYIRPELYLGVIIGNTNVPANCVVNGKIIADGIRSLITVDRGATLHIEEGGELQLKAGAVMRCTHNEDTEVLFINGRLVVDNMSQIKTFESENIVFGPKGKVVILNPSGSERRLLFTTPSGLEGSDLYRIFLDDIDHVEYHVSSNTGIGIDKYFESYSRDMTYWFGKRRFEKAIHDGILKWHDGAYIELYNDITPWVSEYSTLLSVGRLFKSYGSNDEERLQDVVDRLRYAGCENILFRFINGEEVGEVLLSLEAIRLKSVINNPLSMKYVLNTDNTGDLFIRNRISTNAVKNLIHPLAKMIEVPEGNRVEFTLP